MGVRFRIVVGQVEDVVERFLNKSEGQVEGESEDGKVPVQSPFGSRDNTVGLS